MSSGFARQINAAVGGDLSGNLPNPTVVGITGNPIQPTTLISLNDGYIPTWVNVDGLIEWKPAPIGFAAGGDLSGSNTNQTVIGIDGRPVSSSAPSTGESLVWSGSAWAPSSVPASGPAGGDLLGTYPNPTVYSASGYLSAPIYFIQRWPNLPTDLGYQDQMFQFQTYSQLSLNWYSDNASHYGYGMWMDISADGSRDPASMAGQSGMLSCIPYYGTFWNTCMGAITNSATPSGQLCLLSNQTQVGTSNPLSTSGLSIGCSVNFPNQMFLSNIGAFTYNVNSGDRFDSGWITPNACIYNPFLNATSGGTYSNTLLSPSTTYNGGSSDHVIAVDSSVSPYTVTLIDPQMSALQFPTYIISDVTGHAATNNITIQNPDSSTLTTINSNFGSVTVLWQTNSNAVDSHGVFTSGQYIVTSNTCPPPAPYLYGDVSGYTTATSVIALQGYSLAISSPAPGNLLKWNGTDWIAATPPTLSTISSPVNTQTANYSVVQYTDYNIFVDTTTAAAPVSITLDSSPVNGETYYVKDSTGSASTYNITVSGSVNIDGASTYVINLNYACVAFTYNGSQWSVMGTYNGTLI